jgi:hypothetical protein
MRLCSALGEVEWGCLRTRDFLFSIILLICAVLVRLFFSASLSFPRFFLLPPPEPPRMAVLRLLEVAVRVLLRVQALFESVSAAAANYLFPGMRLCVRSRHFLAV